MRLGAHDVLVVGAGIAGAVASSVLARAGADVACLDTGITGAKIGETVPMAAFELLRQIGLEQVLARTPTLPVVGSRSLWGEERVDRLAIQSPASQRVVIDRARFEIELRIATRAAGVELLMPARAISARILGDQVEVTVSEHGREHALRAAWVIDCTGRRSLIGRSRGARRRRSDALVAAWRIYTGPAVEPPVWLAIESLRDGWFYSVPLPGAQRVVAYFTDSDLLPLRRDCRARDWEALLSTSALAGEMLDLDVYDRCGPVRVSLANSSCLEPSVGERWVAAGDAALGFDPLSSQGIVFAISSGSNAAGAIVEEQAGRPEALATYERWIAGVYADYRREHNAFYSQPTAANDTEFWSRRVGALVRRRRW